MYYILSHVTAYPIPTEKILSLKKILMFSGLFSALTLKEFQDSKIKITWMVGMKFLSTWFN